ncbi:TetR/AcrR family transcriptional regulator [Umezawaea tangerina]|uniref:TetR family transcriptional regulator n=1 Tax=Umezawaea tangerina TaxID=84725 RepID=A0A2T0SZE2_9PSEU|nr:TetR/AcrR family transcriptional regulator [Umezawaea tangerina]PRY38785.1 TetR family transcriptional regulator [Umezawaea tangerina]
MTGNGADPARPGLRERKKLMTRQAILDVAAGMFAERGYDNVTVAEIADAVNVSAKTVFVYFPTKDDLVFHGEDEVRDRMVATIRDRPSGQTPLDAMGRWIREELSGPKAVDGLERLRATVGDSVVLRSRMRLMWERFEDAVADLLAEETGADRHAPEPRVVAAQLVLVYRLLASEEVLGHLRSRPRARRRAAFAEWLDVSLRLAGAGIGDYARRP